MVRASWRFLYLNVFYAIFVNLYFLTRIIVFDTDIVASKLEKGKKIKTNE